MKKFILICVAALSAIILCSAAAANMADSKVTVSHKNLSYTMSLDAAVMVYRACPEDLRDGIRQALIAEHAEKWNDLSVSRGSSYGLTYRFDGVNETFDAKYENFSMNVTGITSADIRSIFSLNK